ncbi:hypothetical protein CHS0354_020166 [Potamilus streckersoni]|uniref:Radial spoke head 14 homolog n=1 Tax=Potamilus streckersoni TaxID=2493646 RepID=A0AAE0S5R8_9BIVA|nr:hypothetical protein CHS0354_020166 [Potamilus streckersoni]
MALTVISAKYPPHIDPTKTPLAYGSRALPRLRELNDKTLLVRQRAVMALCDHLHDPEHIAEAFRVDMESSGDDIGIAESLKKLLSDPDITVRQKSTECLFVIAGHAIGRNAFLEHGIIPVISKLFDDKEDIARKNSHMAIEMLSETPQGAEGIVTAELVPILVKKLKEEVDEIKELILDTLHFCLRIDSDKALKSGAMEVFTELLQHSSPVIRAKAARDIMDLRKYRVVVLDWLQCIEHLKSDEYQKEVLAKEALKDYCVTLEGKDKAVEVEAIPALISLLKDESPDVRANAAGALMTITITTRGKYTAIKSDGIQPLVDLVDDPTSEVRAYVLKVLTCLSEAPEGRQILLNHVDKIKQRTKDTIPAVARAAEIAVRVIEWKP